MSPLLVLTVVVIYFAVLFLISRITSRRVNVDTYFTGNRQSPWFVVAFGMIGASLSGITFISVPGEVGNSNLYYFQLVLGYLVGYFVIATVLLPLYYRLRLKEIVRVCVYPPCSGFPTLPMNRRAPVEFSLIM